MAQFDRFDICNAYAVLEWEYNLGGWLQERPSNKRRMEATSVQLARLNYRPEMALSYDSMSDNAREIYRAAEARYGFRPMRIRNERAELIKALDGLETMFTVEEIVDFDRLSPKELCAQAQLILKTMTKCLSSIQTRVEDTLFYQSIPALEDATKALADTLDWLFDEPIAPKPKLAWTKPGLTWVSVKYNASGYVVFADDTEVYRAGNSPYDSTEVISVEYGLPLARIKIMADKTAIDVCAETDGCYAGSELVDTLP